MRRAGIAMMGLAGVLGALTVAAGGPAGADTGGCAPSGPAVPDGEAATVEADVDGDGVREVVTLTRTAERDTAVLSVPAAGGPLTVGVTSWFPPPPRAADVDGDGREELVLAGGNGNVGADAVQVWGVRGCTWVPVSDAYESPALIPVGVGRAGYFGVTCTYGEQGARLVVLQRSAPVYGWQRLTTSAYRWSGLHLEVVGSTTEDRTVDELAGLPTTFECGRPTGARPAPTTTTTTTTTTHPPAGQPAPPRGVRVTPRFTG
jgi:hypothetical protein